MLRDFLMYFSRQHLTDFAPLLPSNMYGIKEECVNYNKEQGVTHNLDWLDHYSRKLKICKGSKRNKITEFANKRKDKERYV